MNALRAAAVFVFLFPAFARAQQAVLWVPDPSLPPADILSLLEARPELRLTAAFPELSKDAEERVRRLEKDGRLETALRLPGDPPLPLLYAPASDGVKWEGKPSTSTLTDDPYFLGMRLGLARDAAAAAKRKFPAGFVNPPGGLAAGYFPLARALGLKWIACGPLASTAAAVMQADGVYAVPFVPYSTVPVSGSGPVFTVFDETSAPDPAALRAALAGELSSSSPFKRVTVSEALSLASSTQTTAQELSALAAPWSGDYTRWAAAAVQAGALTGLAKTRAELMRYLNSVQGSYKQAAPAFEEYFSAEEGAKLLAIGRSGTDAAGAAETEALTSLANAYRLMLKAPPPWVLSGLGNAAADESEDRISVAFKDGGFTVTNVRRKPEVPARAQLSKGADPYKVWKLASFTAAPGAGDILFSFSPAELDAAGRGGFGQIRLDLYIDINHRPRAGMTRPLDGRPLRLFPDNAWEYALEVTPEKAVLYTVTPKGPAAVGTFQPKAENGAVTVRVPRAVLKGNPLLWSYAALLLAPSDKDPKALMITDYIAADISNGYIYAVRPGRN